jgi:hypothetical protein
MQQGREAVTSNKEGNYNLHPEMGSSYEKANIIFNTLILLSGIS